LKAAPSKFIHFQGLRCKWFVAIMLRKYFVNQIYFVDRYSMLHQEKKNKSGFFSVYFDEINVTVRILFLVFVINDILL
jgi:hypothetical protein